MVEIREEYPYINKRKKDYQKVRFYASDSNGERYLILKENTGEHFDEVIDDFPSKNNYIPTELRLVDFLLDGEDSIVFDEDNFIVVQEDIL